MDELRTTASRRAAFLAGLQAELPIMLGVSPFGLIFGAVAVQVGVPPPLAQGTSSIIFAGSAQFISAPMLAAGVPLLIVVLTVFVVNLRHALYSASLAPYVEPFHPLWKMLLAYLLTDEAYAVVITHYTKNPDAPNKQWYFLGAGLTLWVLWQISTAVGILIGAQVPPEWSLDFALPLTFIALIIPHLGSRAHMLTAIVAGLGAVAVYAFPYKLGLILATALGIAAGMIVSALLPDPKVRRES